MPETCETFGCGHKDIRRGETCPKCGRVRPGNDSNKVSKKVFLFGDVERAMLSANFTSSKLPVWDIQQVRYVEPQAVEEVYDAGDSRGWALGLRGQGGNRGH